MFLNSTRPIKFDVGTAMSK